MGTDDDNVQNASALTCVNPPSFDMSKTEVTVRQYRVCVGRMECEPPNCDGNGRLTPQTTWTEMAEGNEEQAC